MLKFAFILKNNTLKFGNIKVLLYLCNTKTNNQNFFKTMRYFITSISTFKDALCAIDANGNFVKQVVFEMQEYDFYTDGDGEECAHRDLFQFSVLKGVKISNKRNLTADECKAIMIAAKKHPKSEITIKEITTNFWKIQIPKI